MKTIDTVGHAQPIPSEPLRLYSQIVAAGLILPRKSRYTIVDVRKVLVESLFRGGRTLTELEARAVVKCSAHFHETDFSRGVRHAPVSQ